MNKNLVDFVLQEVYNHKGEVGGQWSVDQLTYTQFGCAYVRHTIHYNNIYVCTVIESAFSHFVLDNVSSNLPPLTRVIPDFGNGAVVLEINKVTYTDGKPVTTFVCYGKLMGYASGGDPDDTHTPTVIYMKEDKTLNWTWVEWAKVVG